MYRALAVKELRESFAVLALGTVTLLYFAAAYAGQTIVPFASATVRRITFIDPLFALPLGMLAGILAIALGLRRSGRGLFARFLCV